MSDITEDEQVFTCKISSHLSNIAGMNWYFFRPVGEEKDPGKKNSGLVGGKSHDESLTMNIFPWWHHQSLMRFPCIKQMDAELVSRAETKVAYIYPPGEEEAKLSKHKAYLVNFFILVAEVLPCTID